MLAALIQPAQALVRPRARPVGSTRPPTLRKITTFSKESPILSHLTPNARLEGSIVRHRPSIKSRAAADSFSNGEFVEVPAEDTSATGRSTFTGAVFNVVNVMMGVGLLSLPFALKSSGWIGIGLLWLMGIVTNYTGQ